MVVLRATKKVLKVLPESASDSDSSDTALGDWYVNRIVIDRRPLLLLVSAGSHLAMLAPARDVRNLPGRIGTMVADRLTRLGIDSQTIRAEVRAMDVVRVARTRDRSITGQMVEFARAIRHCLPEGWDDSALRLAEDRLSETPCLSGRSLPETIWPDRTTVHLLMKRWRTHGPTN